MYRYISALFLQRSKHYYEHFTLIYRTTIKCTCDPLPYLLAALCTKMQDNKTGNTIVYLTTRPYILSLCVFQNTPGFQALLYRTKSNNVTIN